MNTAKYYLALTFCFLSLGFVKSQTVTSPTVVVDKSSSLDPTILALIKNAPKKDLISVIGKVEISDQVIRTDNLVFHDDSELVLTNYNYPYVIIAVKNLKFNAPAVKSKVRFGDFNLSFLNGVTGNEGVTGQNGTGNGGSGRNGTNGMTGGKGKTKHTPSIYIIVDNINTDFGDIASFDWQVSTQGLEGGQGGAGGAGGRGGSGTSGRNSRSNPLHCESGAGDGGRGGNGGVGGKGGIGGNGGNGGFILLVGNNTTTDRLTFAQYSLDGGPGGNGGTGGISGSGGSGGNGGRGSTHCSGGDRGGKGTSPTSLGTGSTGVKGKKGDVKIINTSLAEIF